VSKGAHFRRANKNPLGAWLVQTLLLKPSLKRAFGGVYAHIDPATLKLRSDASRPIIFCMTHSGWYDGHIAFMLNDRVFRRDGYLMMEEVNLARYFFFTWLGVFGVDRDDVRNALVSIDYISDILRDGENTALFVFPQGEMKHPDERPIKLYSGVATIARKVGRCALVPVAVRYDFIMEQAPDAFVRIGPPTLLDGENSPINAKELTNHLTDALTLVADQLHGDVSAYNRQPYRRLMSGRGSINRVWDNFLRLLGQANVRHRTRNK